MYPVGVPLDGTYPPRPDGLYGATKVFGEALGRMYVDRFGLSVVCLRIGSFQERPRESRELATWLSHADGVRLVQAALTRRTSASRSSTAPRTTPAAGGRRTPQVGFEPQDDAEIYADELEGEDYPVQGGPNSKPGHGGWAT